MLHPCAQVAQANAEIAGAVATANALLRKLRHHAAMPATANAPSAPGSSAEAWRHFSSNAASGGGLPEAGQLPAMLGGALQELAALVSESLLTGSR